MKRILIIEDNPDILAAISDLLEDEGYSVTSAPSVESGLERLAEAPAQFFGCVILDNFMPGLTGQDFINRIADPAFPTQPRPPVLVITTNPDIIQAANLPFAVALLPKPLDVLQLIKMVAEITNRTP